MRVFANLFLILFVADGSFSLLNELLPLLFALAPFTLLQNFLAGIVIVMAVLLYFCTGIDARLPKKVLIPLILFVLTVPLAGWFLPALAGWGPFGALAAASQLLLGMLPLRCFRNGRARSLTMPAAMFAPPLFSWRNSLSFCGANLVVLPVALVILGTFMLDSYLVENTAGFMRLYPGGLRMIERVYVRGDRTVRLAAMIHVGNREFYDELVSSIAPGRIIVLSEGVSDDRKLLTGEIDYGKMAGYLGLTSQQEMHFKGRVIDAAELQSPGRRPHGSGKGGQGAEIDILRADLDVSDFQAPTVLLLNAVARQLQAGRSFTEGFLALSSWGEKNLTAEMTAMIMDDILHKRNMVVTGYLDKALARYATIVIPWGALHMQELEAEVLKKGFKLQSERQRRSIDFYRLLFD